jgi:hypothetical protein
MGRGAPGLGLLAQGAQTRRALTVSSSPHSLKPLICTQQFGTQQSLVNCLKLLFCTLSQNISKTTK